MSTLNDAKMYTLKDKILAQEVEEKKKIEEVEKIEEKVIVKAIKKSKGRK